MHGSAYTWKILSGLFITRFLIGYKFVRIVKTAKGPHTDPEPPRVSMVANRDTDLLCLDFMKEDPGKNRKENIIVMMDASSKFSVAVMTPNHKAKTIEKALVDKWFDTYRIPARIHSNQGKDLRTI